MEDHIHANAELVRDIAHKLTGAPVAYDVAGVRWLDAFIDGQRTASDEVKGRLPQTLGSFLGECLRQTYGGQWLFDAESGNWMVRLNQRLSVYPFNKVRKQLAGEDGESVAALFDAVPALMNGLPPPHPAKATQPWWKVW
jgi:hypothetical protein